MIDSFTEQLMMTLVGSLQAVTPEGNIDHKTRISALKEARALLSTLLPKLSPKDRETVAKTITDKLSQKMAKAQIEEAKLKELLPDTQEDSHDPTPTPQLDSDSFDLRESAPGV